MTPAAEGFAALHEMYTGMRAAGFSMLEAAAILGASIAHAGGNAAPGADQQHE